MISDVRVGVAGVWSVAVGLGVGIAAVFTTDWGSPENSEYRYIAVAPTIAPMAMSTSATEILTSRCLQLPRRPADYLVRSIFSALWLPQ